MPLVSVFVEYRTIGICAGVLKIFFYHSIIYNINFYTCRQLALNFE